MEGTAKALLLRGTHEMQRNDFAAAEKSFTLAKSQVDPKSGFAQIADNALADVIYTTGRHVAPLFSRVVFVSATISRSSRTDTIEAGSCSDREETR